MGREMFGRQRTRGAIERVRAAPTGRRRWGVGPSGPARRLLGALVSAVVVLAPALLIGPCGPTGPIRTSLSRPSGPPSSLAAPRAPTAGPSPDPGGPIDRPLAAGGEGTVRVLSTDPSIVPNDGIETNVTLATIPPPPAGNSFQVGVQETIGAYVAVFGLFENGTLPPTGFFEIFSHAGNRVVHLAYGAPQGAVPGVPYEFRLSATGGGTNWTLTLNGGAWGSDPSAATFDFGSAWATSAVGLGFSEVAFTTSGVLGVVPPTLLATAAFAVRTSGAWRLPGVAEVNASGGISNQWGTEGSGQASDLVPGEVRSGTSVPDVPNGTVLWSGGPVPVHISLSVPTGPMRANLPVVVEARVTAPNGSAAPGIALAISDSLGGSPAPGVPFTDPSGAATLGLVLPNVTANATDVLTVASALLGADGKSLATVLVLPEQEIRLSVVPGAPTVPVGGRLLLRFEATASDGRPAGSVLLEFSTGPGGTVAAAFGTTDGTGQVVVAFLAGPSPASVVLRAVVIDPGSWGGLSVPVEVRATTPSPLGALGPYLLVGLAILLGAVLLQILRRRRGRRAIPGWPEPRGVRPVDPMAPARPAGPVEGGPGGSPTRTPPSGGSP